MQRIRLTFLATKDGKLGSYYYMKQLNTSEAEVAKIRAYLNFDMVSNDFTVHH
jgi:Zn-dependent M28 family amino/carboxypeptidase